jgi:hypothetical protein
MAATVPESPVLGATQLKADFLKTASKPSKSAVFDG